ncbi:(R)-specific enoyl-CoA hydratase [Xylophilus ampelinus]|nr:(R)-specific enoyl-CoA hydratase [Xylophilus ampelinus]
MLQANGKRAAIEDIRAGEQVEFEKTVSESDVYLFAGITGDFSPNHVNERYMQQSVYGRRLVQGALLVGLTAAAASKFATLHGIDGVAAGYDKLRFLAPVFLGDTVRVEYRITRVDLGRNRTHAGLRVTNQDGTLVLVGDHLIKFIAPEAADGAARAGI